MVAQHGSSSDFATFVEARWPVLVRSLVVEGLDVAAAEAAVVRALARLRPGWGRVVREQDADRRVWADVREEAGLPPEAGAVAPGLDDPGLVEGAADVVVSRHPLGLLDEESRRRRRRTLAALALAAVVVLLVGAYLAWATTRTPAPEVVESGNPAPVPWYAEGWLHLDSVAVALPRLDGFVATGDDEVTYVDTAGRWHTVDADGDVAPSSEPDAAPALEGMGGIRTSPDGRFIVRLGAGGAYAYDKEGGAFALDRDRGETVASGTSPDVRVLDAAFAADGTITYVLSNVTERRRTDAAVRLSETGTQVLRTCTLAPLRCRDVLRLSGSVGALRVR